MLLTSQGWYQELITAEFLRGGSVGCTYTLVHVIDLDVFQQLEVYGLPLPVCIWLVFYKLLPIVKAAS